MRYAIMSDIHSNPQALQAALADARSMGCERFFCLGDITGYGYDVSRALELVRMRFDVVLMGNHDSACLGLEPKRIMRMCRSYDLDAEQGLALSGEERSWLKSLPYEYHEKGAAFVHGDFTDPKGWNYIDTGQIAASSFSNRAERLLFCGHTHSAAIWERDAELAVTEKRLFARPAFTPETCEVPLEPASRYLVNVGSVGYPRRDLCSTYVIWDSVPGRVAFRRIPFDFRDYAVRMSMCGKRIPRWVVKHASIGAPSISPEK